MATNFSPCKGSYVLNQFPSNVMFDMNGFHVSASGAIQGHQSSRSRKIVRESRINEIKHVQTDKLLREFTHNNHLKRHFRSDRFS